MELNYTRFSTNSENKLYKLQNQNIINKKSFVSFFLVVFNSNDLSKAINEKKTAFRQKILVQI